MAFASRFDGLTRQTIANSNNITSSSPSIFTKIRCMPTTAPNPRLFVGCLAYTTDDPFLKEAFSKFRHVSDARVVKDLDSGRSRGFGFITYVDTESATSSVEGMNGKELHGRNIFVTFANEKPPRVGGGGSFGGERY